MGDLVAEKSFGSQFGYGGCADLFSPNWWLGDMKTKDFTLVDGVPHRNGKKARLHWPNHARQLAAYGVGFGMDLHAGKFVSIFVSTINPGEVYLHEWDNMTIIKAWATFNLALMLWQDVNDYHPSVIAV